ncbi:MAG: ATP-dependent DNA helicase RecQ [Paludibacteraceae bacterium]
MQKYLSILKQYWGYDEFRPLQQEIIESIAKGNDTLGLMPTGGGKSLTFQVPSMILEGICIVVTPLIALMKDQVENLKKRGIRAAAIFSGMSYAEIDITLDNAIFGGYKFLYVSPERLGTEIFINKIKQMQVCLLAVDEAHCISQWGYDFRPSYLKIAEIRDFLPQVPILALTATATPEVVDDIQTQLHFSRKNVFRKSFLRKNLAYIVRNTEKKEETLLKILKSVSGTSVVYVRSRKKTKETADFLKDNQISAEYFHAGLSSAVKDERQSRWKTGETRVIVCTNAFGMGIDKPNVRSVIHIDLPDTLEAYFQEAGRAGRDEKKAFSVLLFNPSDETKLKKRIADMFPPKETVKEIYDALGNYFTLAIGVGEFATFSFDLIDFCGKFHFAHLIAYNSIKILQQAGYVELADEDESVSLLQFISTKESLYKIKISPEQEQLIHVLLRSYTGLFTDLHGIHENTVANRLNWSNEKVYNGLIGLSNERIIKYIPRKKTAFITFTKERTDVLHLNITKEAYDKRKEKYVKRISSVLNYANEENICRSRILLRYFGETETTNCGVCDICLKKKEEFLKEDEYQNIRLKIILLLEINPASLQEIVHSVAAKEQQLIKVIRLMQDSNEIYLDNYLKYTLKK